MLIGALANFEHDDVPPYILESYHHKETKPDAIQALENILTDTSNEMLIDALSDKNIAISSTAYRLLNCEKRATSYAKKKLRELFGSDSAKAKQDAVRLLGI